MTSQKKYDLRDILNRIKWTSGSGLDGVEILFVSRGEPDDTGRIEGREISTLGPGGIETATRTVPYHRVTRITRNGVTLFERP